jgi:hypothetical protein
MSRYLWPCGDAFKDVEKFRAMGPHTHGEECKLTMYRT